MNDHFCGWYYKCQSAGQTLAVIPAIHRTSGVTTCSIQFLTETASWSVPFPPSAFRRVGNQVAIGENRFGPGGLHLALRAPGLSAAGTLRFGPFTPLRYDIMGPLRWVPFLECRHSVFSMRHSVTGRLEINGVPRVFQNGTGYAEGDRGRSFPTGYVWTQSALPDGALMLAAAEIPWGGFRFTGVTAAVLWQGKEYRLATYLGARAEKIEGGAVVIRQGAACLSARLLAPAGSFTAFKSGKTPFSHWKYPTPPLNPNTRTAGRFDSFRPRRYNHFENITYKEPPMPNMIEISDFSSPELDAFARLTEGQLRRRMEPEKGLFIAESPKVIQRALDAGYEPVSLLMERRQMDGPAREIITRCGDIPVYTADREVLASLTGYSLTRGVLCAMRRPPLPGVEDLCAGKRRIAVLESIVDPTNVGAIFRSAAALNMDAVLVTPTCCDPLYRRSVRVSMGTVFQVPWTYIGHTPADWPGPGLERLRRLGFRTAAMALCDTSVSIEDPRLAAEDQLAIVLGTEGDGLSPRTIADCDYTVRIPMAHQVDSLNVAAASAVAFWQLRAR